MPDVNAIIETKLKSEKKDELKIYSQIKCSVIMASYTENCNIFDFNKLLLADAHHFN